MAATVKGLDFARALLEKYGWKEGKGLGRNEDGIAKALKPAMKFDQAGVGHTGTSDQFTSQWWEQAYNKVAKTITIVENKGDVQVQQKNREELFKSKNARPSSMFVARNYNDFVKTDVLTAEGVVKTVPGLNIDTSLEEDVSIEAVSHLTDEEIFQACGGRTVHKGARHGLRLNGKLARIQRQEQETIIKYHTSEPNSNTSDFEVIEENQKLIKPHHRHKSSVEGAAIGIESQLLQEEREKKEDYFEKLSSLKPSRDKKRKEKNQREYTETISAVDETALASSLHLGTDINPKNNTSKKRRKEHKEIEETRSFEVTHIPIIEIHKKIKKKKDEGRTDSEITNPILSEPQKKRKKKNTQGECERMPEITESSIPEPHKKRKEKNKEGKNEIES